MSSARTGAAAVLLSDGRVLIAGGSDSNGPVNSADLFGTDGRFSSAQPMNSPRSSYAAALLEDGRVLVTGGVTSGGGITNSAEIYDPSADTWTLLSSVMVDARSGHTASLLADGRVLLAGGQNSGGAVSSLEIFDPAKSNFSNAGVMSSPRMNHATAVLADGRALIVAGSDGTNPLNTSDIYDPGSGSLSTGPNLSVARTAATATPTLDGKIVVIGGNNGTSDLASAEIFDPTSGQFTLSASSLSTARSGHRSFLLPNNNSIFVMAGSSSGTDLNSAELYYAWVDTFQPTGAMSVARPGFAGSALTLDGHFLAAGGAGLSSTELYGFATVKTDAADYAPGTQVNITGSGWQPGETVTLTLVEVPYYDNHGPFTAVADSSGNISDGSFVTDQHDANIRFYLTAVGSKSAVQAQNTFTDANEKISTFESTCTTKTTAFNFGDTVCAQASGLGGNESYDIQWFNSSNVLQRTSPSNNSQGGSFTDTFVPNSTGTWTVKIFDITSGQFVGLPATFTVAAKHSTTTAVNCVPGSVAVNATTTCTATVIDIAPSGATTPTGSVSFSSSGSGTFSPGSCTLSGSGSTASCFSSYTPTAIGTGTHTITSSYAGNSNFEASNGTFNVTVTKRATSTGVTCSPNPDNLNSASTCTVTVSDTDAGSKSTPIGTVNLSSSGTGNFSSASCTLSAGTCSVTYTPTALGTGTHTITGSYNGDTTHATSGGTFALTVNAATNTSVASSLNPSIYGSSVTFTATITPSVGSNGTVTFKDGATVLCSAVAVSSSSATCSTPTLSAGVHSTITAVFSGGGGFAGSTSNNFSQTVNPKALTVTGLTASNKIYDGTTAATVSGTVALQSSEAFGGGTGQDGKPYTGDVVSVTGTPSGTFASKDVASGINITVSGLSLTGAQASNYSLTAPTLTANITPKALTYTGLLVPASKIYDATTTAAVSGTAALQAAEAAGTGSTADGKPYTGDSISLTGTATATYNSKDAPTANLVTFAGVSLAGTASTDYTLTALTQAATITPKALTYAGVSVAASKTYDGTTIAVVSGTAALQSAEAAGTGTTADGKSYSGDTVSLTGTATATYNSKDVANANQVTFGGVSLNGSDSANYTLTALTQDATITPKALTYSGLSVPASKVYDGTTAAVVSGTALLQSPETAGSGTTSDGKPYNVDSVSLTGAPTATYNTKDVPTANQVSFAGVSLTGGGNGNYTLTALTQAATVTAKALTYSGLTVPASKVYDGTTAAVVSGIATLQGAEAPGTGNTGDGKPYSVDSVSLTGTPTATYNSKDVATAATVTFAGVSLTGTGNANYTLTALTQAATITPKPLTITGVTAKDKTYDGSTSATLGGAAALSGVVSGDSVTLNSSGVSASFADKNVGMNKPVTVTGYTLSGGDSGNYSLTQPTGLTASITALHITGSFTASNKIYDGTTSATVVTRSLNGTISGDNVSPNGGTAAFADKNVGTGKTVTLTGATLTGTDAGNYVLDSVATATANITALHITGSFTSSNKMYDGTTSASVATRSLVGAVSGDNLTLAGGTAAFSDKNVGTGKTVTLTGASLSGADVGNYLLDSVATTTADITALHISGSFTANSKTYDGNTSAVVATRSLNGAISGDNVSLTGGTASFADKNVGTAKAVTLTGASLSGTDAGNYVLDSVNPAKADITALHITGTFTTSDKVYDGNIPATVLTRSLNGTISGDVVLLSGGTATFADKNVGAGKTVTLTGVVLSGTDAGNYVLDSVATTTASIGPRPLHVTATADSKQYDGTASASAHLTDDRVSGDVLTGSYTTAAFSDKNVGTGKTVNVSGISISGTDAGNYSLANNSATTTANITPRDLHVTATADSRQYDGTTNEVAHLADDRISGDGFTDSYSSATFSDKNVGTGKTVTVSGISISGTDAGNYLLANSTASATADISPRILHVTAKAKNKQYDGNTSGTATLADDRVSGDVFTDSYTSAAFSDKNVGNGKTVNVSGIGISGTDAGNYTANSSTTATADITARPLTITATGVNKIYDGSTAATVNLSDDRIAGDEFSDTYASATFADKNVGATKEVSVSGITIAGTDAGNYTFNQAAATTADITPRALTVTATGLNKPYDGTTAASVTLSDNRVSADSLNDSYTSAAFTDKNVGTGKTVNVTGISISGTDAGNYSAVNTSTTTTANITARNLHVTATAQDKQYDGTTSAIATLADDKVSGDFVTESYASAVFSDKNVGTSKTVTVAGISISGADAGNYILANTSTTATASITARPLTVTASTDTKIYDGTTSTGATPTITSGSIASGDTASFSEAFDSKDAGSRNLVPSGSVTDGNSGNNYAVTFKSAAGKIDPKPITVTADSGQKVYGTLDPALTYQFTPQLIAGDSLSGTLTRVVGENVGSYAISQGSLTAGPNYTIAFNGSTFIITQAASAASVTTSVTPSVFGQQVAFTATVTDNSPGSSGTPTGNVQFYVDGSPFGSAMGLSGGKAVLNTGSLPVSTHAVYAIYAGDGNFTGSTALTISQVVNKDSSTVAVTTSLPTSTLNQSVKFTATVTANAPGSGTPSGTVTFYIDNTGGLLLGTANLSSGSASLNSSAVPVSNHSIVAVYSGDNNFTTSSGSVNELVQYATGRMCDGDAGHQILQPINVDGSSVFKLGSTVPTKFRVCDANGVSIGTAGIVTGYGLLGQAGGQNISIDEDVYSNTPDTNFRWDPTAQQWIFNQSTKNNPTLNHTGTIYYFGIQLNDGTMITFQYGLK